MGLISNAKLGSSVNKEIFGVMMAKILAPQP